MIPTRYKSKLSHTLSYPIGAEAVSESLKGVPQELLLTLGFYDRPMVFASTFIKLRESNSPYPIFDASFRHIQPGLTASNKFIADGWYEETWELSVYPVPRQLKPVARQALLSKGLPEVKKWLIADRSPTWRQGRKHCKVLFVEANGGIIVSQDAITVG